tara:strand:- start:535 stop:717 length:183 start_codon:yes stop_codon:yes gene_type:complete
MYLFFSLEKYFSAKYKTHVNNEKINISGFIIDLIYIPIGKIFKNDNEKNIELSGTFLTLK